MTIVIYIRIWIKRSIWFVMPTSSRLPTPSVCRASRRRACRSRQGIKRRDDGIEPVDQRRRSRLQDDRRLDFDDAIVADRRAGHSSRALPDLVANDLLAAPGRQDDIGRRAAITWSDETMRSLADFRYAEMRKNIVAAGDARSAPTPSRYR